MPLTILDLTEAKAQFRNSAEGASTLANPSPALMEALVGLPTASGVVVTKERALRCATFLAAVKMLANDIAKMPRYLMETKIENGRQRTRKALDNPLYPILHAVPNQWMTAFQLHWANVFHLFTQGNFYNQKVKNGLGDIVALVPLDPWCVRPRWDMTDTNNPKRLFDYSCAGQNRTFASDEIWTCSIMSMAGIDGQSIIALGKDALSMMLASDETAGRFFANGLHVHGFYTLPPDMQVDPTDPQQQKLVDGMKKFAGSRNAGGSPILPGGTKYEKMSYTAVEGQLLESRKWNAEEIVRLLGGAPLCVKLGYGDKNSTYASSSAFLEEYFSTTLLPITVNIEQSITRDLIAPEDRGTLYVKHSADEVLRGSPEERAKRDEIDIRSGKRSPNECRLADDLDPVDGWDKYFYPANSGVFDPDTQEMFIPGQKGTAANASAPPETPETPAPPDNASARLLSMASAAAERVIRKEQKGGKIDAEFVADVMSIPVAKAAEYLAKRHEIADARAALIALATEGEQQ
jgi:HK97 family phage portal protein